MLIKRELEHAGMKPEGRPGLSEEVSWLQCVHVQAGMPAGTGVHLCKCTSTHMCT